MSVWDELVSQEKAVTILANAVESARGSLKVAKQAMTQSWLITGPPGSGRSNAAKAFAAALLCPDKGCGKCQTCRTALSGAHPDVTFVSTEKLSISVDDIRQLVLKAAMAPTIGPYQIIVVEDADRVTDRGADALLKSVEEPAAKTVWVLCAPTVDDVIVTIRSRCRKVHLRTPTVADITRLLVERDGVDPIMAGHAARAAQGHIGLAKALATKEDVRNRREQWLKIPGGLQGVGDCLMKAEQIVNEAKAQAQARAEAINEKEEAELKKALGFNTKGARPKNTQAALKELERQQKLRAKRTEIDELDAVLTQFSTWYRDVLAMQLGAADGEDLAANLINSSLRDQIARAAENTTSNDSLRCIDAILQARKALENNVSPLLAFESLLLQLAKV